MEKVEVIKYYYAPGKEYIRELYDAFGNWIGIEERKFVTLEEAIKMGYKPKN